jgi:predicted phage tail protein
VPRAVVGRAPSPDLTRVPRRAEYDEMVDDKDRIIRDRDLEIEQLQKKMEDMSQEFADMLKQTLDRMSQKIEQESGSMGVGDTDPSLAAKLSEFKLGFVDI